MLAGCLFAALVSGVAPTETVDNLPAIRNAMAMAAPGATILVTSGTYEGGLSLENIRGTAENPITLRAADPRTPPVFTGAGIHLSGCNHVVLQDLTIKNAKGNGLNIDDAGRLDTPSRGITLRNLTVRDVGPRGNLDGIKLSGLVDFHVENCVIERWGSAGSAIDMVGCARGTITGCDIREGGEGASGIQAKGGSEEIAVRSCRFENAGERALNLGGSTGMAYFRPKPQGFEARNLRVENCTFLGGRTPVAFVGVDGAVFRRNTILYPGRWALRILQETRDPGFVPSRNGQFLENLIVFRSQEMIMPVNIGDGTAPETFTLRGNAWYCEDAPARSRPRLPVPITESNGIYGVKPTFRDPSHGDYRLTGDALRGVGAQNEAGAGP